MNLHDEIQQLINAYPNFKPPNPDGLLDVYEKNLSDIPDWLLAAAVEEHIRTSRFFPSVAELREASKRISNSKDMQYAAEKEIIPAWSGDVYWQAMDLFNASLGGEVSDADMRRNTSWIAYERRAGDKQA